MAWNAEGHMVVAQMAYNHLTPSVKTKCDNLIAVSLTYASSSTSNFVTAACWADDNKSALGTGIWHYVDLPFSRDGTPTNGVGSAAFDVVLAIRQCVATLESTNAIDSDRATALRYLLHFAGDIQQPLHCSTAVSASATSGDAGGNAFSFNGPIWFNLHSLWDAGGGFLTDSVSRPLTTSSQTTLSNKVAAVEALYPYTANPGTIPDPMSWALEGLGLATNVAYVGITEFSTPSNAYTNSAQTTTKQRMAMGGHRLADLLNTIFTPMPISLTLLPVSHGSFGCTWNAVAGKSYRVQWKQLAADGWNDLKDITASGSTASFTDTVGGGQRFYRVVILN